MKMRLICLISIRLRKLADMADIKTMMEKELIMHMVMISLPTNVVKQVTTMTINPKLDDVLGMLEVVEQQMRQLNNTNFPLPPDRSAKKKKTLSANVSEETTRGRQRRRRRQPRGMGITMFGGIDIFADSSIQPLQPPSRWVTPF